MGVDLWNEADVLPSLSYLKEGFLGGLTAVNNDC